MTPAPDPMQLVESAVKLVHASNEGAESVPRVTVSCRYGASPPVTVA